MKIIENPLEGVFLIEPTVIKDERGYFYESFNERTFHDLTGQAAHFVQDNQSYSSYGVIRGLHAQAAEYAQAKLVRVLSGEVLDVIVDGRKDSKSYGQSYTVRLNAANRLQLYIPRGFFHGFAVLSDTAEFFYKCDNFYRKDAEVGVFYDDPDLGINWGIADEKRVLTDKDMNLPLFKTI